MTRQPSSESEDPHMNENNPAPVIPPEGPEIPQGRRRRVAPRSSQNDAERGQEGLPPQPPQKPSPVMPLPDSFEPPVERFPETPEQLSGAASRRPPRERPNVEGAPAAGAPDTSAPDTGGPSQVSESRGQAYPRGRHGSPDRPQRQEGAPPVDSSPAGEGPVDGPPIGEPLIGAPLAGGPVPEGNLKGAQKNRAPLQGTPRWMRRHRRPPNNNPQPAPKEGETAPSEPAHAGEGAGASGAGASTDNRGQNGRPRGSRPPRGRRQNRDGEQRGPRNTQGAGNSGGSHPASGDKPTGGEGTPGERRPNNQRSNNRQPGNQPKAIRPNGGRQDGGRQQGGGQNGARPQGARPQGTRPPGNRQPGDRQPGRRRPEYSMTYNAPPSLPIPTDRGIKARSHHGSFSKNWWARRWIEAMERLVMAARLQRGRSYARAGQVLSIQEIDNGITSVVQGSRPAPYRVEIKVKPLTDEQWEQAIDAMAEQALFTAQLLAGEMPGNIEDAFETAGVSLFPSRPGDLTTDCTCPDWANPCKHVAATHYILGDRFDDDPFLLFRLRGRTQEQILEGLRLRRAGEGETVEENAIADAVPALLDQMNHFWESGEPLDTFQLAIRPPNMEMPLLQRLGEPAFLSGESLQTMLRPLYGIFLRSALRAAYSEDEPAETSADDEVINGG